MYAILIDIIGWSGVVALLAAYILVSLKKVAGDSTFYQGLNILGAVFLAINSLHYGAYPSIGINIAWIVIAVYAVARR